MTVEMRAADVMETDVMSVAPELPLVEFERLVLDARIGGMPVVEDGKVVGIISRSDVVRHLVADQAAEAISTEYYWDLGGGSAVEKSGRDATAADVGLVESMLEHLTVADLMVDEILSVAPGRPISEVAEMMASCHVHRILVIEHDILLGVITTMDLTRLLAEGRAVATR